MCCCSHFTFYLGLELNLKSELTNQDSSRWRHVVSPRKQIHTSSSGTAESAMTAAEMFAGVDIGGTGVKVGVVTSEGVVVAREQEKYHPEKHEPQDVVDLAVAVLHKVLRAVRLHFCSGGCMEIRPSH
jgi:hypothetical protein